MPRTAVPPPGDIFKRLMLIKHRLMLSAAAAALLAAAAGRYVRPRRYRDQHHHLRGAFDLARVAISPSIAGPVSPLRSPRPPSVTINSNNSLTNNGSISNVNADSGLGVLIDTSGGNIFPPSSGLASTGTIDLSGSGTNKRGIVIQGGNTYLRPHHPDHA